MKNGLLDSLIFNNASPAVLAYTGLFGCYLAFERFPDYALAGVGFYLGMVGMAAGITHGLDRRSGRARGLEKMSLGENSGKNI